MKSQHRVRAVKAWQCSSPTAKTQIARCKISLDLTKLNDDGGYAAGQLTGDARAGAWGGSEKKNYRSNFNVYVKRSCLFLRAQIW